MLKIIPIRIYWYLESETISILFFRPNRKIIFLPTKKHPKNIKIETNADMGAGNKKLSKLKFIKIFLKKIDISYYLLWYNF